MDSFAAFKHSRKAEIRRAKLMGLKVSFIPSNPDIKPELMPAGLRRKVEAQLKAASANV